MLDPAGRLRRFTQLVDLAREAWIDRVPVLDYTVVQPRHRHLAEVAGDVAREALALVRIHDVTRERPGLAWPKSSWSSSSSERSRDAARISSRSLRHPADSAATDGSAAGPPCEFGA